VHSAQLQVYKAEIKMVLGHQSYGDPDTRKENMKLKKMVWQNEEGEIKETTDGLPKGWRKGKLLGATGQEVTDAQAKEWGISSKAKAPKENKSK
jgi:hypothetical protein|tara:strand:- start:342 stop:623 length:282 start_codon:yes stop_codon:yes gene_type:complete